MKVICDYCGKAAKLVGGTALYPHRPDLARLQFWQCEPCSAHVGCHKGTTTPLGRLADKDLREAKQQAHSLFDPIWKDGRKTRSDAYSWLALKLGIKRSECHIGLFNVETCGKVVQICQQENAEYDSQNWY